MFKEIRRTALAGHNGDGIFYADETSGMEVFHIKNDSAELCCSFMFSTPSEDSTGVAHILEHTVLCGSGRFPVKDPFSQILLSSPNTFLNAMTFTDKTIYPFASPLKKDFDILFDIYSDAVFNPLLRRESFMQEGVRYSEKGFDGVVFNEMRGARNSEDDIVQMYSVKDLFRGTPCEFDSGGDPLCIPELTYEMYCDRYRKWYSPANCRLFLYGNLDAGEYLTKLEKLYLYEDNLKKWDCKKIIPKSENYIANNSEPIRKKYTCPSKNTNDVVLTWLTEGSDNPLNILTLSTLVDILLGNPGAPLYKAIVESELGEDLNSCSGMDADYPVMPFTVGFTGAVDGKEDEIEKFIISELEKYVKEGLPEDAVKAAVKKQEFQIQEIPGDSVPYGLKTCLKVVRTWMRGLSPEQGCDDSGHLEKLKQGLCEGRYFEKWIQRNLLANSRRCLLTVTTDTGYEEKTKACLSALLRKKTESGNREEYKKQLVEYERFAAEDDSPEALSCIPRIRVSDIPENIPSFDAMPSEIEGCRTVLTELFTRGISYLNLSFGTSVLEDEEKPFAALLVRLMQMCGTEKHDYTQISNMINFFTGSFTMSISASADVIGNRVGEVSVRTKMLDRDVPQALDVITELLGGCILTSAERIQTAITDMLTEFDSNYLDSASSYASLYAGSVLSPSMLDNDYFKGTGCWFAIRKIKDFYANNYEYLSGILTNIHSKLFSVSNMRIYAGCDSDFTDELRQHLARFVRTLNKVCRAQKAVLTVPEKMYVRRLSDINFLTVSSGPAYNVSAVPVEIRNEHERVSFMLLGSLLGSGFLWDNIRGRNGAYGVESHLNLQESIFFMSTYRDPKIRETFELFEKSLETVISDAEIEYAIVTVLGRELKPLSPQLRCAEIYRRDLLGLSDALYLERRTEMLKVSASDIRNAASVLSEAIRKRCIKVSVCSLSSVAENFLQGAETTELPL